MVEEFNKTFHEGFKNVLFPSAPPPLHLFSSTHLLLFILSMSRMPFARNI